MVALVLRTIEAFKVFDIIWVMTRGGPANSTRTLSILVYQEAFSFQRAGSGASLALIVTLAGDRARRRLCRTGAQDRGECRLMERKSPVFTVFIYVCALLLAAVILAPIALAVHHEHLAGRRPRRQAAALVAADGRFLPLSACCSRRSKTAPVPPSPHRCATASRSPAWRRSRRIALAIPAGWAVSRTPSVGWSLSMVIATYMLPPVALAVPLYMGLAASRPAQQCLRPGARLSAPSSRPSPPG